MLRGGSETSEPGRNRPRETSAGRSPWTLKNPGGGLATWIVQAKRFCRKPGLSKGLEAGKQRCLEDTWHGLVGLEQEKQGLSVRGNYRDPSWHCFEHWACK